MKRKNILAKRAQATFTYETEDILDLIHKDIRENNPDVDPDAPSSCTHVAGCTKILTYTLRGEGL